MRPIGFIDVTLRDAHQSLWSTRMTTAMMLPMASRMDSIGYEAIDLVGGAVFDVCVRYLREDPWERIRLVRGRIERTPLNMWTRGQSLFTFELFPDDVVALTVRRAAANGIRRLTVMDALNDARNVAVSVATARAEGLHITGVITYSLSPVHTDAYFVGKAQELVQLGVDAVILKDQSGLLTPERVSTLVPALRPALGPLRLQLHSHCLTGLAPRCYLDAVALGADTLHTAISPLANGASLPPTESLARSLKRRGHPVGLDETGLAEQAAYFAWVARREGRPLGEIAEHDPFHYEHQTPGGMISNLRSQLRELGIEQRLQEILEEAARVRRDLGYPVVVSPFAQFVMTQAVLNVVQGERYRTVPDEVRKYALGHYGELAAPLDPEVADRVTGGKEPERARPGERLAPALERVRRERGPFRSEDDLLLACFYSPEHVDRLLAARPIRTDYPAGPTPVETLLKELGARRDLAYVHIARPGLSLTARF